MVRLEPGEREIYRHFKGSLYQVEAIAKHTETGDPLVVYRSLYEPNEVYARPLSMFMEKVDRVKYPDAAQEYRFEKVTGEKNTGEAGKVPAASGAGEAGKTTGASDAGTERSASAESEAGTAEFANPRLLAFLDADTYAEKLNLLTGMREYTDERMLNAIAMSLDLEVNKESVEEKYEEIKHCLITLEKYECNRLR